MKSPRIGIMQRVLPAYRAKFFDMLAEAMDGNLSVFAGEARKKEMIAGAIPNIAKYSHARNHHLFDGRFYLCWQGGLMDWLEQWQPEVLIMEANLRYVHSQAAIRWMRSRGGKVIGWGLGAPLKKQGIVGYFRKYFVNQFDAMITYSSQGAEEYAALGIPRSRIFVAPNAAAAKPKHGEPTRPNAFRGGKPVVVFVGRLQERKRVEILIRGCAGLPEDFQPIIWIIGDGPDRKRLEELAAAIYPLAEFCGAQHGDELAKRLALADLFVLPGTGGLAVQEAMSFGLPVIVGEADGTQSDLVRAENGWLLEEKTPEALRELIADALQDIATLRNKGAAGYRIVQEEVNLEKMIEVFKSAIHEVPHE